MNGGATTGGHSFPMALARQHEAITQEVADSVAACRRVVETLRGDGVDEETVVVALLQAIFDLTDQAVEQSEFWQLKSLQREIGVLEFVSDCVEARLANYRRRHAEREEDRARRNQPWTPEKRTEWEAWRAEVRIAEEAEKRGDNKPMLEVGRKLSAERKQKDKEDCDRKQSRDAIRQQEKLEQSERLIGFLLRAKRQTAPLVLASELPQEQVVGRVVMFTPKPSSDEDA